jgi:hypothetical protein
VISLIPGTTHRSPQKFSAPGVFTRPSRGPGRSGDQPARRPLRPIAPGCAECCGGGFARRCVGCCGRGCAGRHSILESAQATAGARRRRTADIPVANPFAPALAAVEDWERRDVRRGRCRGSGRVGWCCAAAGEAVVGG